MVLAVDAVLFGK